MENELAIGSVSASLFLTIILGLIYRTWVINNTLKPWIAILLGLVFSAIYMVYNSVPFDAKSIIDYGLSGFMVGATSIGLNELGVKKVLPGKKQDPEIDISKYEDPG